MKRLFPASLALLLVIGSLGHVLAAAFCPRMPGHDCCLKTAASDPQSTYSHQHMHSMAMGEMPDESMAMDSEEMRDMMKDDADVSPSSSIDEATQPSNSAELVSTDKLGLSVETCHHCLSHSGVPNAPIASVNIADQFQKEFGSVPLPVSRFRVRPPMTLTQIGLPGKHAPPGTRVPRHILINVFLI